MIDWLLLEKRLTRKEILSRAKELFDYYDDKYFDGELKNCGIKITFKTKSDAVGIYSHFFREIGLMPKWVQNEDILKSVLLHEMIHAWIYCVLGDFNCGHCKKFIQKMNEINRKENLKIPISVTANPEETTIDDEHTGKYRYSVIFKHKGKEKYSIVVFSRTITKNQILEWLKSVSDYIKRTMDRLWLVFSDNSKLDLYISKKSFSRVRLEGISQKDVISILSGSKEKFELKPEDLEDLSVKKEKPKSKRQYLVLLIFDEKYLKREHIYLMAYKSAYNSGNLDYMKKIIDTIKRYAIYDYLFYILLMDNQDERNLRIINSATLLKKTGKVRLPKGFLLETDYVKWLINNYEIYSDEV